MKKMYRYSFQYKNFYLTRRRFIKRSSLFFPVLGIFLRNHQNLIQWTGVLELPKQMSWAEFKDLQTDLMDLKYIDQLEANFSNSGDLLKVFTVFDGRKVTFTYIFKNINSYERWSEKSSKGVKHINKTTDCTYTCNTKSVSKWDIDWSHPKNKIT